MRDKNAYYKEYRQKERNFQMQELYEELQSVRKVAAVMKISFAAVARRLRMVGLTQPKGSKRWTCIDCDKPTGGNMRCALHSRIHGARVDAAYRERKRARLAEAA